MQNDDASIALQIANDTENKHNANVVALGQSLIAIRSVRRKNISSHIMIPSRNVTRRILGLICAR